MAILELGHIRLATGLESSDATVLQKLLTVKQGIEAYSGLPTYFYQQVDDSSMLFVFGAWSSKDSHQHGYNGSPQQTQTLASVKDQMTIDWMQYMDIDHESLPVHAPVLGLIKETLPKHVNKTAFDQNFAEVTQNLGGARYGAVSAWNLRKDKHEPDIRVHFSGWESIDEAMTAMIDIIEHAEGFQVKPTSLNILFATPINLD
ncbi:hypothetical protein B0A52_04851 [Exophiala mesophila]|uniref:ABM domain-containing protein n=1 Tax=Exophiala mesophila TaxID=212818 RepID=A0A438N6A5_EXOME|nr:hypothetical protein B0A52_04851 [Exophiala mesophila]